MRVPRPEDWLPKQDAPRADSRPWVAAREAGDDVSSPRSTLTQRAAAPREAGTVSVWNDPPELSGSAQLDTLWVNVDQPERCHRGRLAEYLDDQIEQHLVTWGAPDRATWTGQGLSERVLDQLYRARLLGSRGFGVRLCDLGAIAEDAALDSTDSRTLCWWLRNSPELGVRLLAPDSVYELKVFVTPVSLRSVLDGSSGPRFKFAGPRASTAFAGAQMDLPFDAGLRPELRRVVAKQALSAASEQAVIQTAETQVAETFTTPEEGLTPSAERLLQGVEPPPNEVAELAAQLLEARVPAVSEVSHLRAWRDALEDAAGVQTWADLERQFVASYLPLSRAVSRGEGTTRDQAALAQWANNFVSSYAEAYGRLCRFSRRPEMIFDLPKLAFQLARQEQATQTRLVLVDGLRFDIGQRVHDKLRLQLTGAGRCVARGVLWAALPAETGVQLELLARGPDGLRTALPDDQVDGLVAQGAAAQKLRPLRAGPHHLLKLDCVEELRRQGRTWDDDDVEEAACNVANNVARFLSQQAPQTLLVLFGDHGFSFKESCTGGARPEQVLVPYDAWLLDERP